MQLCNTMNIANHVASCGADWTHAQVNLAVFANCVISLESRASTATPASMFLTRRGTLLRAPLRVPAVLQILKGRRDFLGVPSDD